jgi:hypothetical protein
VIAFLAAPFVGVLLSVLIVVRPAAQQEWWIYLVAGSAVAYASALIFGIPAYLLMKRLMILTWWKVALAGVLCGVPYWVISAQFGTLYFQNNGTRDLFLYLLAGGIAGSVFWFIRRTAPSNNTVERDGKLPPN